MQQLLASYSITCPGLREPATETLRVKDTKGPEVKVKDLIVKPGTEVLVEDFIAECTDPSVADECEISLSDESDSLEDMVKEEGEYTVKITARDDRENSTEVEATLTVSKDAPSTYLSCKLSKDFETTTNGTVTVSYDYGANDNNELVSVVKKVTYKFKKQSDYDATKTEYEENKTLDGIVGKETFDDNAKTLVIEVEIDPSDIQEELESDTELKTYEDVAIFHETAGDSCSLP